MNKSGAAQDLDRPASSAVTMEDGGLPQLVGSECSRCGHKAFPLAKVCTNCLSEDLVSVPLSREGVLYSYTVVHAAPKGWAVPYAIGYVDLPEDVRVFSHLAGPIDDLRMDAKVRLLPEAPKPDSGGQHVEYWFAPVEEVSS